MQPKKWWQSRTVWTNVTIILIAAFTLISDTWIAHNGQLDVPAEIALGVGLLNIWLRFLTSQPIGDPAAPPASLLPPPKDGPPNA